MASDPHFASLHVGTGCDTGSAGARARRGRRGRKRRWPPLAPGAVASDDMLPESLDGAAMVQDNARPFAGDGTGGSLAALLAQGDGEGSQGDPRAEPIPGSDTEDAVIDPELVRLLHGLNATIDTAHQVLYAAANAQAQYVEAIDRKYDEALPPPPPPPPPPPEKARVARTGRRRLPTAVAATFAIGGLVSLAWFMHDDSAPLADGASPSGVVQAAAAGSEPAPPPGLSRNRIAEVPKVGLPVPPPPAADPAHARDEPQLEAAAHLEPDVPAARRGVAMAAAAGPVAGQGLSRAADEARRSARAEPTAHAVSGRAGGPIPLGLQRPETAERAEVSVMVQGVPEGASLSAGQRVGADTWILTADQMGSVALVAPADFEARTFNLDVTLVTSDGKIPDAYVIAVAVDPAEAAAQPAELVRAKADASAVPPSEPAPPVSEKPGPAMPSPALAALPEQPDAVAPGESARERSRAAAPPSLSAEAERQLLEKGQSMLRQGDATAARLIFEHAARRGSRQAMTALARSWDPDHLAQLGVRGLQGDKSQAEAWYRRAAREADR